MTVAPNLRGVPGRRGLFANNVSSIGSNLCENLKLILRNRIGFTFHNLNRAFCNMLAHRIVIYASATSEFPKGEERSHIGEWSIAEMG